MPTNKKRIAVIIEDDMRQAIDEYCIANGIKSIASAVQELMRAGVEAEKHVERIAVPASVPFSAQDVLFLARFRRLSAAAREKVLQYMESFPKLTAPELAHLSDALHPDAYELIMTLPQLDPDALYRVKTLVNAEVALHEKRSEKGEVS